MVAAVRVVLTWATAPWDVDLISETVHIVRGTSERALQNEDTSCCCCTYVAPTRRLIAQQKKTQLLWFRWLLRTAVQDMGMRRSLATC